MKRIIAIFFLSGLCSTGISCSVQDEAINDEAKSVSQEEKKIFNDKEFSKAFAEGLAEGLKDIKIDFTTLFKYNNESELKSESERMFKFMLDDMPYEMTHVKDAAYMVVIVDVAKGRAVNSGMYFINESKDILVQKMLPNSNNEFDVAYNLPYNALERNGYTLVDENVSKGDATILSKYLLAMAKGGKTGSFMIISTTDKASLYLKS